MATYTVPAVGRHFNREFVHRHWTAIVCLSVALLLVLTFLYYITSYRSTAASLTDTPDWFQTRSSLAFNYQQCPPVKEEKINIHVLAHSHDDVAWLKTFDQYYYGTLLERQNCGVQFILDSVVDQLLLDENRRFVYVEIAFFWRWWNEQTEERKAQVKQLVRKGQLEFAGGGWSMNDEASTNYLSIIDNFSWGFRKLKEMFGDVNGSGARPKVGWQIDPFGHSREQASIFAQLGFDGVFLNRIDYQDKAQRMKTKKAEFIWETSPNFGSWADIFSVVLYNHYSPVEGFHYGYHRKNDAVVDDPNSPEYNVDVMVGRILKEAAIRSQLYNTNHIFITWGDDFTFENAHVWFKNIDKIIKHINEGKLLDSSKYNIFYSTPSCFVKCVNDAVKQKQLILTTKRGDFFPYAMSGHAYWTGYYTSRPTLKYALNLANRFLQVSKQLMVLSGTDEKHNNGSLDELRSTIALMQHHDAITGTSQQHVVDDYKSRMTESVRQSAVTVDDAIKKMLGKNERRPDEAGEETERKRGEIKFDSCLHADELSECHISESGKPFVITIYNPSSRPVTHYVRLPVAGDEGQLSYSVLNPQGEREQVQLVSIAEPVRRVAGRSSSSTYEIVFRADNIPPLGMRSYYVAPTDADDQVHRSRELPSNGLSSYTIGDVKRTSITLDGSNNSISSCTVKGTLYPLQQSYLYYLSKNRPRGGKPSGAYVFNPENKEPFPVTRFKPLIKVYSGLHVDEVHMEYTDWVSQVVRIYKEEDHIEFNWLIGPLGVMRDYSAKEVIVRYKIPDLKTDGTFFTDSNGREMMKRVRNKRDTWKVEMGASTVSGNYYPVTCRISVSSGQTQMSIVLDRPEGGTSLTDGEIELMIHRESAYDDELGMGEPLTDVERDQQRTEIRVRGRHYLTVGNDGSNPERHKQNAEDRILVDKKHNSVWTFVTALPDHLSFARWNELFKMEYFGLKRDYVGSIPDNIRIITLEPWSDGQFLLRLEHFMEKTDNVSSMNEPTVVNIDDLFRPFKITAMKEMCLAGDILKSDLNRLKWMSSSQQSDQMTTDWRHIEFDAMQIRTFLISVAFSD